MRVSHPASTGNAILSNSIFSNGVTTVTKLGIDLDPNGVTANDAAADEDSDSGPNNLQNFPVLNSIGPNSTGTTIEGELDSAADTTFTVQFFSSPEKDPSDHGEGKKYLGQKTDVTTDASGNATFTFTTSTEVPASEFLTATATSPDGDTSEFSKAITVEPPNRAPDAVNDTARTSEDTAASMDLLANDTDPEHDALTVTSVSDPANGTAEISGDGRSVTYTPDEDYNDPANPDSFTYTVSDGEGLTDTATVEVTVTAVNDPPSFDLPANPDQTVDEDAGAQTVGDFATNVSAGPTDESGQSVSFTVTNDNSSLFFAQPEISSGGTLTYTPATDANGSATVTVTARDDGGTADGGGDTSGRRTFTITVNPVNDVPVAVDDSYTTDEDQTLAVAAPGVLQNDSDVVEGTLLKAAKVAGPSNGTLTLEENGSFEYRPDADFHGADSFTYKACDGPDSCSAPATVSITVNSLNEPPTISDMADRTVNQNTDTGEITFTINDDETAASNLAVSASSSNRTLVPNSNVVLGGSGENRTVEVTPVKNRFGSVNITIKVSDGEAEAVDTFTLTVVRDLTAPTITVSPPDLATKVRGKAKITATFSEKIQESTLSIEVVKNGKKDTTTPVAGTSSYDPQTNTLTFDPDNLLKGTYQVTVRVEDEAFNPAEKTWSFTTGRKFKGPRSAARTSSRRG